MLGLGAFQAVSQISASQQQAKAIQQQSEYNAQVYDQQASTITHKQKLEDYKYRRQGAIMRGAITAQTAGKGLLMSGSPLAILADSQSELELDRAIGNYNLELDKHYAKSGATHYRQQGRMDAALARKQGYLSAFSTLLSTGMSYMSYNRNPLATKTQRIIYRPTSAAGGRTYASPYGNTYRY